MDWPEDESTGLMASVVGSKGKSGEPDWSRFGLSSDQQKEAERKAPDGDSYHNHGDQTEDNELFAQDQVS